MTHEERMAAQEFVAKWFGFHWSRVSIFLLRRDRDGDFDAIGFRVRGPARISYLARRRKKDDGWRIEVLP